MQKVIFPFPVLRSKEFVDPSPTWINNKEVRRKFKKNCTESWNLETLLNKNEYRMCDLSGCLGTIQWYIHHSLWSHVSFSLFDTVVRKVSFLLFPRIIIPLNNNFVGILNSDEKNTFTCVLLVSSCTVDTLSMMY